MEGPAPAGEAGSVGVETSLSPTKPKRDPMTAEAALLAFCARERVPYRDAALAHWGLAQVSGTVWYRSFTVPFVSPSGTG